MGTQNTPGADFVAIARDVTCDAGTSLSPTSTSATIDYSDCSNLALYSNWQELSRHPETYPKTPNLIWTEIAANMVGGIKGLQSNDGAKRKRDETTQPKTPSITYHTL
jgi:hypothetical protein